MATLFSHQFGLLVAVDGDWTCRIHNIILNTLRAEHSIVVEDLPPLLLHQLAFLKGFWPEVERAQLEVIYLVDPPARSLNRHAAVFSISPTRRLPAEVHSHHTQTFHWAHNTNATATPQILSEELVRPSTWEEIPLPQPEDDVQWRQAWVPANGFYCRGSFGSKHLAITAAMKHGRFRSYRPFCVGGTTTIRQGHASIPCGGVIADTAASHVHDLLRAKDNRRKLRSSLAIPEFVCLFW